jgi:hypothetical protein
MATIETIIFPLLYRHPLKADTRSIQIHKHVLSKLTYNIIFFTTHNRHMSCKSSLPEEPIVLEFSDLYSKLGLTRNCY